MNPADRLAEARKQLGIVADELDGEVAGMALRQCERKIQAIETCLREENDRECGRGTAGVVVE